MIAPLFILTPTGRSGTTLVMSYLHQCPKIVVEDAYPYEFRLFSAGFLPLNVSWKTHVADYPFQDFIDEKLSHLLSCKETPKDEMAYYGWLAGRQGKRAAYAAEKLPGFPLELARQSYPTSKFLIMIRDPRDALASVRAFNRQRGFRGFAEQGSKSDQDVIRKISRELDAVLSCAFDPDCSIIKYENLITQPNVEIERLARFLGIAPFRPTDPPKHEQHRTSTSASTSIGRWRRDMSNTTQNECGDGWATFLDFFDYAI